MARHHVGDFQADVVFYDPQLDIAVLRSEELTMAPLQWASATAVTGEDAIVMGFPNSGPFEAAPARIGERLKIAGPNIYATGPCGWESLHCQGSIRQEIPAAQ